MKLLSYGDWKQRIAFDNIAYKDVKRYSLSLNSYERNIMDVQINFYRKHFSLLQVMKSFKILKTKADKETFIKAVLKRSEHILYIPYNLLPYFRKKIKDEFKEYRQFFELLLDKAHSVSNKNDIGYMIKSILGEYYCPVMKKIKKLAKTKESPVYQKLIKPAGIQNTARIFIDNLKNDLQLATIYGRSSIRKSVPISIVDDSGYGEWVSKEVSYNNDRLFIYSNHNRITDIQLQHMIYFNVYPGYGYFYDKVVQKETNMCFDNGATYLINGWAMYAMCKSKNSTYANNMLIEGAVISKHLLSKNLEKAYDRINVYLLGKYPKSKVIDYMLDYTQYPGHYLSYVLGALAIEECINRGFAHTPVDFLESLSHINCGDFFALYSPKMQKKIFKTTITAKVTPRFNTHFS